MTEESQADYAGRLAKMLNIGVLQDAVAAGLEDQGPFKIDALELLGALESAGLKLAPDEAGDVATENAAIVDAPRDNTA